jgi:hypothetical protein
VLSLDELQEHGYPLPRFDEAQGEMVCPEGFVATRATKGEVVPCAGDTGWLSASWRGGVRVGERARRWLREWMGVGLRLRDGARPCAFATYVAQESA